MATILGTQATEVLNRTADDDVIIGFAGADFIFGRDGDDRILGGSGIDGLNGEDGNDVLIGGTQDDAIFGGDGDDTSIWRNGGGSDFIRGDDGQDTQIVSGSLTDGDNFNLDQDAGLGQALFSRSNLGLFELRIDTVETLRIVGNGGDDNLVVNDLSSTSVELVTFA